MSRPTDLVDAYWASAFLTSLGQPVTVGQIHNWAYRGQVGKYGTDRDRLRLYSLAELQRRLDRRADTPLVTAGS